MACFSTEFELTKLLGKLVLKHVSSYLRVHFKKKKKKISKELQYNFNNSNIFGTMKIYSRHG